MKVFHTIWRARCKTCGGSGYKSKLHRTWCDDCLGHGTWRHNTQALYEARLAFESMAPLTVPDRLKGKHAQLIEKVVRDFYGPSSANYRHWRALRKPKSHYPA